MVQIDTGTDQRQQWIWSAVLVLVPVSIWTICKSGGSYNSLLFAYLAMSALFAVHLDLIMDWAAALPRWAGLGAAIAISLTILCSFFVQFDRDMALLSAQCGDDKY